MPILRPLIMCAGLACAAAPLPAAAQQRTAADSVLTLAEAYALALAQNPTLHAAQASARAVAAQEGSARLPPDPQVQLGVMNASLPGLETNMPTSMAPSLQVMQMLPLSGKLALSGRIARQSSAIAEAEVRETEWEVRARAAMFYYEIYRIDRQLVVMRETVQLLESFQQVASSMYSSGEGRQSDVLRASVEVARMNTEIARMQAMRIAAVSRLNAVLNRPTATPIPAVALPPLPLSEPPLDALMAWAESSRPMLARYRMSVERAETRGTLAGRELWPDLTVGLQYGQRPGPEVGTERMGSLMLGFSVPVFAARRQLAMRRETAAMTQMASAELSEMRALVGARIAELTAELERNRTLVRLYRTEVLPQARAAVASALSSYRVGAVDFMTLVDAQMMVNRYQQELYALLAEYGGDLAELEMALGRELPATHDVLRENP